jgi:hypothetical protein
LAELVAEGQDALLGPGALLVAPRAAESRVELPLAQGIQQRHGLQPVARRPVLVGAARVDRVLHPRHDQLLAELGDSPIAKCQHLVEVVPGVDVQDRAREARRPERLLGQPQQDDRSFPPLNSSTGRSNSAATSRIT